MIIWLVNSGSYFLRKGIHVVIDRYNLVRIDIHCAGTYLVHNLKPGTNALSQ